MAQQFKFKFKLIHIIGSTLFFKYGYKYNNLDDLENMMIAFSKNNEIYNIIKKIYDNRIKLIKNHYSYTNLIYNALNAKDYGVVKFLINEMHIPEIITNLHKYAIHLWKSGLYDLSQKLISRIYGTSCYCINYAIIYGNIDFVNMYLHNFGNELLHYIVDCGMFDSKCISNEHHNYCDINCNIDCNINYDAIFDILYAHIGICILPSAASYGCYNLVINNIEEYHNNGFLIEHIMLAAANNAHINIVKFCIDTINKFDENFNSIHVMVNLAKKCNIDEFILAESYFCNLYTQNNILIIIDTAIFSHNNAIALYYLDMIKKSGRPMLNSHNVLHLAYRAIAANNEAIIIYLLDVQQYKQHINTDHILLYLTNKSCSCSMFKLFVTKQEHFDILVHNCSNINVLDFLFRNGYELFDIVYKNQFTVAQYKEIIAKYINLTDISFLCNINGIHADVIEYYHLLTGFISSDDNSAFLGVYI